MLLRSRPQQINIALVRKQAIPLAAGSFRKNAQSFKRLHRAGGGRLARAEQLACAGHGHEGLLGQTLEQSNGADGHALGLQNAHSVVARQGGQGTGCGRRLIRHGGHAIQEEIQPAFQSPSARAAFSRR